MHRKLKIWGITAAACAAAALFMTAAVEKSSSQLSEKFIRLHVVANSDSADDQALKLRVRDSVLAAMDGVITRGMSREEAAAAINAHLSTVEKAALDAAEGWGVTVTLSDEYYPTREYDGFSLPAGEYLSLRVMIGEAQGQNWWCVVFPPLCTELCIEDAEAVWGLGEEEAALITGEDGYVIRFRLIEWWEQLKKTVG